MSILEKVANWFTKLAQANGLQSQIERYIESHRPENAADVDRLINLWDRQKIRNWM